MEQDCRQAAQEVNITSLANGVYTVIFNDNNGKIQTRLLIAK